MCRWSYEPSSCPEPLQRLAFDIGPAWFPDGARMASSSNRDGAREVQRINSGRPTLVLLGCGLAGMAGYATLRWRSRR
jgi:hypothetical protein